ncbi:MAG TPA: NAD(P)H-dependent oxidoreductase [Bacilli bacterium]|nr:NAD(P)H-dependent oxidoreductase [Bacilli bacterium]
MKKIGIIVGSLRKASNSQKIADNALNYYKGKADAKVIEIGHLPLYNADYELDLPESYVHYKKEIESFDSFLFIVPEYNRTMTPAMKNAIDVASRPFTSNKWNGKTVLLVGHSIGKLGAYGAVNDVRKVLGFLGANVLMYPEVYLGPTKDLFNEDGTFVPASAGFMDDVFSALLK